MALMPLLTIFQLYHGCRVRPTFQTIMAMPATTAVKKYNNVIIKIERVNIINILNLSYFLKA